MKKSVCSVLLLVSIILGLAAFVLADSSVSTYSVPQTLSESSSGYWTKERMQKARPYPMPTVEGSPERIYDRTKEMPGGAPGFIKGKLPEGSSLRLPEGLTVSLTDTGVFGSPLLAAIQPLSSGYDYPPPHTTFNVLSSLYGTTSSTFPYKAVGKVFFTKVSDGLNYVCSGSSIGGRAVLTAGHCVSDGNQHYHKNWTFVPAYKNGTKPYGTWPADWMTTFTAWHANSNLAYDVAFVAVTNQVGKKLSAKVGNLGFAYNYDRVQHWNMFGFPQASPYDGKYMVETQASFAGVDTSKDPNTTGIGTVQTPGCSGGPWILSFSPSVSGNYANGVNSYLFTAQPKEIFSPYFNDAVKKNLYDPAIAK